MNRFTFCFTAIFSLVFTSCMPKYSMELLRYQRSLQEEWNNPETTPLKEDEKENFKGIAFFPKNKDFRVKAKFTQIENGQTVPFPTSANKIKHYKEYAKANFKLDNQSFELTIYQPDPLIEGYENLLFLPFTDETNGITTYGGGRYIDLDIKDIKNKRIVIDFNKAYNPYCAYSKYYNCPIPPANNYLAIEINVGVSYSE